MDPLDRLRQWPLPFAELIGVRFTSAAPEKVTAELIVREDLSTSPAILHGGAIMAFADTMGAAATVLNLAAGAGTTTIESKTNFLAPAPVGSKILAETTPVHRGRRHHGLANPDYHRGGTCRCAGNPDPTGARPKLIPTGTHSTRRMFHGNAPVASIRPVRFSAVRGADLELTKRDGGYCFESASLDRVGDRDPLCLGRCKHPGVGHVFGWLIAVPAEPAGSTQPAQERMLHHIGNNVGRRPGVQDRPSAFCDWLLAGATLRNRAPVGRHHLHVHAELFQQIIGHITHRRDRHEIGRIDDHHLFSRRNRLPSVPCAPCPGPPASPRRRFRCRTASRTA